MELNTENIVNLRRQSNGVEQTNMRNLEKINIPQLSQAGDIKKLFAFVLCRLNAGQIGIWKCWILRRGQNPEYLEKNL